MFKVFWLVQWFQMVFKTNYNYGNSSTLKKYLGWLESSIGQRSNKASLHVWKVDKMSQVGKTQPWPKCLI